MMPAKALLRGAGIVWLLTVLRIPVLCATALAVAAASAGCAAVPAPKTSIAAFAAPDNALMIVIADPRSERRRRGIGNPGYSTRLAYADDPVLQRAARSIASDHKLQVLAQWPLRNLAVHCIVVAAPHEGVVTALQQDPRVSWVQPFNKFDTQSETGVASPLASSPPGPDTDTDTETPDKTIDQLFDEMKEMGNGVRIAVIDTSIDSRHPDLLQSSVRQHNFAGDRGAFRAEAHGTAVVGLIAARPGTPEGMSGFASGADVQVLRACWQNAASVTGTCNTLTLALALDAAIDLQPQVLNLSLTGQYDRVLEELLTVLLANDTLVIAAFDDTRAPEQRFPAAQPGVVYAYGGSRGSASGSASAVLTAPRHAMSLSPKAGYDLVSGHSIAAPQISALAARLIDRQPQASRTQILDQLQSWLGPDQ